MLHTKFRENRPAGSGEEDFEDAAYKLSFPLTKEAPHKILLSSAKRFRRRCLSIMNGQRTDGRRTDGRRNMGIL